MAEPLRAVKGMYDILPPHSRRWEWVEDTVRSLMRRYGYANVRTPIVEPTALFVRGLGEVTDIVEKEMYTWVDYGESLTYAPGKHRRPGARRHRTLVAARRRQASFLHRSDVSPRAAAERSLAPVPPGGCGGDGFRRPGCRCRVDPARARAVS